MMVKRALESEVIRSLPIVQEQDLEHLREINRQMIEFVKQDKVGAATSCNRRFHFGIFSLTKLSLVINFIDMAWARAAPYHTLVLYDPEQAPRIFSEHAEMIDAIGSHDIDRLLGIMDHHRQAGEDRVMQTLELLRRHGKELTVSP